MADDSTGTGPIDAEATDPIDYGPGGRVNQVDLQIGRAHV